jgi:hypothetical protein
VNLDVVEPTEVDVFVDRLAAQVEHQLPVGVDQPPLVEAEAAEDVAVGPAMAPSESCP